MHVQTHKTHEKNTTALYCNAHVLSGEIVKGDVTRQESPPPVQSGSSGPSGSSFPSGPSMKVSSSAAPLLKDEIAHDCLDSTIPNPLNT